MRDRHHSALAADTLLFDGVFHTPDEGDTLDFPRAEPGAPRSVRGQPAGDHEGVHCGAWGL